MVNGDRELLILDCWVCFCLSSSKSFGQMDMFLTSPRPRLKRFFDLHIEKSSIYFKGLEGWRLHDEACFNTTQR